jgi:hypothetical protein
MHRQDLDFVRDNTVDDPIAQDDDLTDVVSSDLRDHATRPRESPESLRRLKDARGEQFGVSGSISADEQAHRIQVV